MIAKGFIMVGSRRMMKVATRLKMSGMREYGDGFPIKNVGNDGT